MRLHVKVVKRAFVCKLVGLCPAPGRRMVTIGKYTERDRDDAEHDERIYRERGYKKLAIEPMGETVAVE